VQRVIWPLGNVHTHELVASLRSFIRKALDLDPVPADLAIPMQGPARPSNSNRGKGDREGAKGGGRGGGMGMGAGGGLASDDITDQHKGI